MRVNYENSELLETMEDDVVSAPRPCSYAREVWLLDSVMVVDVTSVDTMSAEPNEDEGSTEIEVETVFVETVVVWVSMTVNVADDAADEDWDDSTDSSTVARLGATGNVKGAGVCTALALSGGGERRWDAAARDAANGDADKSVVWPDEVGLEAALVSAADAASTEGGGMSSDDGANARGSEA